MIRINLLPVEDTRETQLAILQVALMAIVIAFTVFVVFMVYSVKQSEIESHRKAVQEREAELKRLENITGEVSKFEKRVAELKTKLDVIKKLKAQKSGPVRLMEDLSVRIPPNVWLVSFREKSKQLEIEGMASTDEDVALFLAELERSPFFENVKLSGTEMVDDPTHGQQKKFKISCVIKYSLI